MSELFSLNSETSESLQKQVAANLKELTRKFPDLENAASKTLTSRPKHFSLTQLGQFIVLHRQFTGRSVPGYGVGVKASRVVWNWYKQLTVWKH